MIDDTGRNSWDLGGPGSYQPFFPTWCSMQFIVRLYVAVVRGPRHSLSLQLKKSTRPWTEGGE